MPLDWQGDGPEDAELDDSVLEEFRKQGVVFIPGGLSSTWVARMRQTVEDSFRHP